MIRQIGKTLRGNATPFQLAAAALLGSLLAFIPSFTLAPGLVVSLVIVLIILNANLGVAALVGGLAKLVSLAAMPAQFQVGRWLLDGPTTGLFKSAINAPVLAYFGFEYYATTGGLALGLAFGIIAGIAIVYAVGSFRRKMAAVGETSERYKELSSKWWAKGLTFIVVGGGPGRPDYAALAQKKVGNPIRPLGVVFVLLVVGLAFIANLFASGPVVTYVVRSQLQSANGATVDLERADLDMSSGKLVLTRLAMADPAKLDTDIFRASGVTGAVNTRDLLRKRSTLDSVVVADGEHGSKRARSGVLVGPAPKPVEPPPPGDKTLDDYMKEAKVWRERLAKAREWLEKFSKPKDPAETKTADGKPETLEDRLRREIALHGYTRVAARHLVEGSPTLLIKLLEASGVITAELKDATLTIRAENLSTQPWLVPGQPRIIVTSSDAKLAADVSLQNSSQSLGTLKLMVLGISGDTLGQQIKAAGEQILKGGTVDVRLDGTWSPRGVGYLDLPMQVTLNNTTLSLAGAGSAPIKSMTLPIGLRGPLDNPGIRIDEKALADALLKAGATELANRVRGEATKAIDKAVDKATDKAKSEIGNKAGDALKGILGGKKKDEKQPPPK